MVRPRTLRNVAAPADFRLPLEMMFKSTAIIYDTSGLSSAGNVPTMCRNDAAKVRKNIKMASVFAEKFTKCHCIILPTSAKCFLFKQRRRAAPERIPAGWARPRATPKRYESRPDGTQAGWRAPRPGGAPNERPRAAQRSESRRAQRSEQSQTSKQANEGERAGARARQRAGRGPLSPSAPQNHLPIYIRKGFGRAGSGNSTAVLPYGMKPPPLYKLIAKCIYIRNLQMAN